MFINYWNYTDCINSSDQFLIEANLTKVLEKEGFVRIDKPSISFSVDELYANYLKLTKQLSKQFWIVGLFPGTSGWTVLKTQPKEFMCRRSINGQRPRLSELAIKTGCKAFHWGIYNNFCGIILEVDEDGNFFVSGYHHNDREKSLFYQENINYNKAWKFHLIDIPEEIKEAIRPDSAEEWEQKESRLDELIKLFEQGIDTIDEQAKLLLGDGTNADQALRRYIGNSSPYWGMRRIYYKAYTEEEKIKADGGKLLYFKLPEYYQQLDYRTEIAAKY